VLRERKKGGERANVQGKVEGTSDSEAEMEKGTRDSKPCNERDCERRVGKEHPVEIKSYSVEGVSGGRQRANQGKNSYLRCGKRATRGQILLRTRN